MPRVNQTLNRRVPVRDAHFDERISSVCFTTDKSRNNLQRTSRSFIEAICILKEKREERGRDQSLPLPAEIRGAYPTRMGRQVEKAKSTGASMNARRQ